MPGDLSVRISTLQDKNLQTPQQPDPAVVVLILVEPTPIVVP
jgi:hypothetical protein